MSQRQIPGGPYVNETGTRQGQTLGGAYLNDTASGVTHYSMPADRGTFILTRNPATLTPSASQTLPADTATPYNVTGFAAGLYYGFTMQASTGSFTFSGAPSLSDHEHDVEKGTFSLTGIAASLRWAPKITAARGTFTLTGNEFVGIPGAADPVISANTGAFTFTGNAATLSRPTTTIEAETGAFTFTGYQIVGSLLMTAETGSFTFTGNESSRIITGRTPWTRRTTPSTSWTRV